MFIKVTQFAAGRNNTVSDEATSDWMEVTDDGTEELELALAALYGEGVDTFEWDADGSTVIDSVCQGYGVVYYHEATDRETWVAFAQERPRCENVAILHADWQ